MSNFGLHTTAEEVATVFKDSIAGKTGMPISVIRDIQIKTFGRI
jgi:hypothetical protein